jgi:hypothetical protein
LAVPFYRIAGPYELTCGVTAEEAEYLDATHIPRAVGRARDVKRAVFDHFQCAVSYDGGHPAIREWVRLSYGALKYLLNPRTMDEVDLPYARDVVVQLSQWYHSQEELRRHYNVYFIPIVETLWGHIEQFRDDSGKHVWRRNVGGTGGYSPTIDS